MGWLCSSCFLWHSLIKQKKNFITCYIWIKLEYEKRFMNSIFVIWSNSIIKYITMQWYKGWFRKSKTRIFSSAVFSKLYTYYINLSSRRISHLDSHSALSKRESFFAGRCIYVIIYLRLLFFTIKIFVT